MTEKFSGPERLSLRGRLTRAAVDTTLDAARVVVTPVADALLSAADRFARFNDHDSPIIQTTAFKPPLAEESAAMLAQIEVETKPIA